MGKGRVLVIDGDDWVARLLADGLRDHGFDVSTCLSGAEALGVAQTITPDCVVAEMVLPELDGPSIARVLRGDAGPLARVPIMFLSNADDVASRKAAFGAGGDVYLTKPFRVDEIALQVQALVAMAGRIGGRREAMLSLDTEADADPESVSPGGHAIEGNIAQMSVATVLTLLEMERRSGVLKVTQANRSCSLDIIGGYAIGAMIDDSKVAPLAVLREILRWQEGRFRFRPGSDGAIPSNRRSIGALLIEAVRLDDESTHAKETWGSEEAPTARRSWPVLPQQAVPSSKRTAQPTVARRLSRPPPPARASKPPPARASKPPPARASKPPPARASKPPPPMVPAQSSPPRPAMPRRVVRPIAPPPTRKKP
jgi:DNA-binding response OmpR family regulator